VFANPKILNITRAAPYLPKGVAWNAKPISKPRKASLKKTLIYRAVVDPAAFLLTYLFTGEISGSILAVIAIEAFSTIFYYILDRLM